ncbi:eamA-like transporter family protein [Clostridium argentinense CDC 2741]|uniref:EamA-like transporter family protein n=1 Tax=Clostridium argentinense CDC 2741 TaxID=1418104 RepID=A0A0C1U6Q4_9CLOT|nr:DMT family transporter [Clostridium argentinense]ARC84683.1 EamA family transporter [Clostridium argentinense]KIE47453.1 eamA-like transporter family protein [Clostridium argentinense CDC 2741]NFF40195.1 DMT family transporter [Clostridium argentinense]NFP50603.1 DMT family transporter [Clostridium argentinense]NFP72449.1 DMT family transporter [Clostridium argentinense]
MNTKEFFMKKKVIYIFATMCCMLWGSAFPAVKSGYEVFNIASEDIPSKLVFAGYRFFLAGLIVLFIGLLSKKELFKFNKRQLGQIALLGITQTCLQYIFFYLGLAYISGAKGSILSGTGAFFSVIIAHYIYINDKLNLKKTLGCIIGFIGVIIVNFDSQLLGSSFTIKGEGAILISALILSASSIYSKKLTQSMDSVVVTGYQLFIGGAVLIGLGYGFNGSISGFTIKSTSLLIYLAMLSSIAFSLWTILLKYNNVGTVAVFNFLTPIFGSILSAIFLHENIWEFKNAIALICVCIGIWLVNRESNKKIDKLDPLQKN